MLAGKGQLLATCVSGGILAGLQNDKRYEQLVETMTMANPDFSVDTFWAYGCNCLMLSTLGESGHGPAVDMIDSTCKKYKDCIRCVSMEYGEVCVEDDLKYRIRETNKGDISCKDDALTCKRAICECDLLFAQAHADVADQYNQDFHMYSSMIGWDPEEQCYLPGSTSVPKCCGPEEGPKLLYNSASDKKCCADGTIQLDCGGYGPANPYTNTQTSTSSYGSSTSDYVTTTTNYY